MFARRALDVLDDLLARARSCFSCLSHVPLLSGNDEPETLSYQITLFGPIGPDVGHSVMNYSIKIEMKGVTKMQTNTATTTHSRPIDLLTSQLELVQGGRNGQYRAKCSVHQDAKSKSRTLSIKETESGSVLVNCFAGCEVEEIMNSIGLALSDLDPPEDHIVLAKEQTKPTGLDLLGLIGRCRIAAVICQIATAQLLDGQELHPRDFWIMRGASQDLLELLDEV